MTACGEPVLAWLHPQSCLPSGARQGSAPQHESGRNPGQAGAESAHGVCGLSANEDKRGPEGLGSVRFAF